MKTKNTIIGLCALAFAIGSAFATLSFQNYEIHVLKFMGGQMQWQCMPIDGICDGTQFTCKAMINGNPTRVYQLLSDCSIRVTDMNTQSIINITDPTIMGQDPYY